MSRRHSNRLSALAVTTWMGSSVLAAAQPIPPAYASAATEVGVPAEAIYALALAASGTRLSDGCTRPWPWTLTFDGHTKRYATRAEAHAAFSKALSQNTIRIRVGLTQLDWRRHKKRLGASWEAVDPYRNLQVGAAILKASYRENKGWKDALIRYSVSPGRQATRVLEALRDAKADLCNPVYKPDAPQITLSADQGIVAEWVKHIAPEYGIDPQLVMAVIQQESGLNPSARSNKNAQGLMQLIPSTAARFGVENPWNPQDNIRGGIAYLQWLLRHFKGDVALALAGYNAGEKAVDQYQGVPPYRETRNYVSRIMAVYPRSVHPIPPEDES